MALDPAIAAIRRKLEAAEDRILADQRRVERASRAWTRQPGPSTKPPQTLTKAIATQRRHLRELRDAIEGVEAERGARRAKALTVKALRQWEQGLAATEAGLMATDPARRDAANRTSRHRMTSSARTLAKARRALRIGRSR